MYVAINTVEEELEFIKLVLDVRGDRWVYGRMSNNPPSSDRTIYGTELPYYAKRDGDGCWSYVKYPSSKTLTLAEFKKEQGLMKYKAGDVLEASGRSDLVVQGTIGGIFFTINTSNRAYLYTEYELDDMGYTLKTDEPAKTDKTVSQIEKELNLPAGTLNVVADK